MKYHHQFSDYNKTQITNSPPNVNIVLLLSCECVHGMSLRMLFTRQTGAVRSNESFTNCQIVLRINSLDDAKCVQSLTIIDFIVIRTVLQLYRSAFNCKIHSFQYRHHVKREKCIDVQREIIRSINHLCLVV